MYVYEHVCTVYTVRRCMYMYIHVTVCTLPGFTARPGVFVAILLVLRRQKKEVCMKWSLPLTHITTNTSSLSAVAESYSEPRCGRSTTAIIITVFSTEIIHVFLLILVPPVPR